MKSKQEIKVGIYARLSRDDERNGESLSIENQKLILEKYVLEQGLNLVETYVDDGYSDTLCAISCAIAESFHGVPKQMHSAAIQFLDKRLTNLYKKYYEKAQN